MARLMTLEDGSAGFGGGEKRAGLSCEGLKRETERFSGTGGVSAEACEEGFIPAFQDTDTGKVYRACFADGRPAPMHVLDGLPDKLVRSRDGAGHVREVDGCVVSGFYRNHRFYTREEAAAAVTKGC